MAIHQSDVAWVINDLGNRTLPEGVTYEQYVGKIRQALETHIPYYASQVVRNWLNAVETA